MSYMAHTSNLIIFREVARRCIVRKLSVGYTFSDFYRFVKCYGYGCNTVAIILVS